MKYSKILIPLVIFAQFALLGGMIYYDSIPLRFGKVITIQTRPVDPRSIFQGDYVVLRYAFSRWDNAGTPPGVSRSEPLQAWRGKNIYAILVKKDASPYWELERMSLTRPTPASLGENRLYLTGILQSYGDIRYGIEQFFVQEGKGRALEMRRRASGTEPLTVEIYVMPDGRTALKCCKP